MRIAVFSADPVICEALASLFIHTGGMDVVACLSSLSAANSVINSQRPDVLVFTEDFADESSRSAVRKLRNATGVKTILLHSNESVDDHLLDDFDRVQSRWSGVGAVCDSLRKMGRGSEGPRFRRVETFDSAPSSASGMPAKTLTARERETADLVVQGMSNQSIAATLGLSEPTIKLYVSKLLRIFDCDNRVQLALKLSDPSRPIAKKPVSA